MATPARETRVLLDLAVTMVVVAVVTLVVMLPTLGAQIPDLPTYTVKLLGPHPATTVVWEATVSHLSLRCGLVDDTTVETEPAAGNPSGVRFGNVLSPDADCEYRWPPAAVAAMQEGGGRQYVVQVSATVNGVAVPAVTSSTRIRRDPVPAVPPPSLKVVKVVK
jgi:hypothetical protein